MKRGKTIQVFLTDGTPRGIKVADITSNIEQALFIPRSQLQEAYTRKEASQPALYFLFGELDGNLKPAVYIGQSTKGLDRIKGHNRDEQKDFWNYAVLITSKTNSYTQTHITYLEEMAISFARESNRYLVTNKDQPKKVAVPETLEADLLDSFDAIKVLLSTLGFTLFESIKLQKRARKLYYCNGNGVSATGEYLEDGFVVHKDSQAKLHLVNSATFTSSRQKLIDSGILKEKDGILIFEEDYLFSSPSSAGGQVLGRNTNGWDKWKTKDGKSLDEIERK